MLSIERLAHGFFHFIVSHAKIVIAFFCLSILFLGWQSTKFEIEASADTLLTKNNLHYIRTQIIDQRFSPEEFLLIAYKPVGHDLFSEKTFSDLRQISEQIRTIDRVKSVRSILNIPIFPEPGASLPVGEDFSQFTAEIQGYSPEQVERALTDHPIYESLIINTEKNVTALQVLFKQDKRLNSIYSKVVDIQEEALNNGLSERQENELERLQVWAQPWEDELEQSRTQEIEKIREILREYEDQADLYLGGLQALSFQLMKIIKNDLFVFGGVITTIICLLLLILFRSFKWTIIPLVCCAFSVVATVGVFSILNFKTTVISSSFVALQIILTLAIVMHLVVQYLETKSSNPDWEHHALIIEAMDRKWRPSLYAAITTSVGFSSLIFSGIQPVIDFGWMMVIAIGFSTVMSLILFPALVAATRSGTERHKEKIERAILKFFAYLSLKHAVAVLLLSGLFFSAVLYGMLRLEVENSFINYFRDTTKVHKELKFIDQNLGGTIPIDITYTIPRSERGEQLVMTAETIQRLHRLQNTLQQREGVGKTLSIVNFSQWAKKLNNDKPLTEYELTAVYWTMDEALREDLLGSFFSPAYNQARINARIQDSLPTLDRKELIEDIENDIKNVNISQDNYLMTNLFVIYQSIMEQLFRTQILTMGIVYGALWLTFLFVFRSLRISFIAIVPNIMATLMVLGMMGWLSIPLDLMTITIVAIAMGIAVDDTIHYIHRYREELSNNLPSEIAIKQSHSTVGYAMLYTSVIVILGFSMLVFSDFMPSVIFGILTGFAMTFALLFNLTVLASLLNKFIKNNREEQKELQVT